MGRSMTLEASIALGVVTEYCKEQTGKSNCWYNRKREYFVEWSSRTQSDNGVYGAIYCILNNLSHYVGTFRIDGLGRIVKGPKQFKELNFHKLIINGYPTQLWRGRLNPTYDEFVSDLMDMRSEIVKMDHKYFMSYGVLYNKDNEQMWDWSAPSFEVIK